LLLFLSGQRVQSMMLQTKGVGILLGARYGKSGRGVDGCGATGPASTDRQPSQGKNPHDPAGNARTASRAPFIGSAPRRHGKTDASAPAGRGEADRGAHLQPGGHSEHIDV